MSTIQISSLHAAHIAASYADSLDDVSTGKGKGKGKGKKRGASARAASAPYDKTKSRRGKKLQGQLRTRLRQDFDRDMDKLQQQLDDIDTSTLDYQARYQQFTSESESERQQSIMKTRSQLVHDAQDFDKDCNDFFTTLKKDYGDLSSGGLDGESAIAEINDLMFKLAKMFQDLRDIVQKAKELFDQLSWQVTRSGVEQQKTAIQETKHAAITAATFAIVGACVGTVCSLGGLLGKGGDAAAILGQSLAKGLEQGGSIEGAQLTAKADTDKTLASLVQQMAEQYHKDVNDAAGRAQKTSSDMLSALQELNVLHRNLEAALSKS